MTTLANYPKVSSPQQQETTQTLAGGVVSQKHFPSQYGNARFQSTATSFLIDCDGASLAIVRGLLPNGVCIAAGKAWGFPQSVRLIVAPDGNPANLDFSVCAGVNVIVRFDNDTPYGWLTGIVFALLRANPKRLQLWNLEAREDAGEFFFMKLGGEK
jgi:hypothetical protein